MALVSFDWKAINRDQLKGVITALNKALEPAIVTPGNIDKAGMDLLEKAINSAIDAAFANVLVVNADPPATLADAVSYLSGFQNVPQASADLVKAHPELVHKLKRFTHDQQEKILANIDWLNLLLTWGPIVLKILLMFLI